MTPAEGFFNARATRGGRDIALVYEWAVGPFFVLEQRVRCGEVTGNELAELLEPALGRMGYELADLEVRLGGDGGLVRVFIDKPDGIDLHDCEKVSLAVSALLDVEDPVPGKYDLEVSSPGLDRKWTQIEHFQCFMGEIVKVQMRFPIAVRRRFRGKLVSVDDANM